MEFNHEPLGEITQKLRVEQTVRAFLQILEQNQLEIKEGLVAWNMLGFTIFKDLYFEGKPRTDAKADDRILRTAF